MRRDELAARFNAASAKARGSVAATDEQRRLIAGLSGGKFEMLGGDSIRQTVACDWELTYYLVTHLEVRYARIEVAVEANDFRNIRERFEVVENAKRSGRLAVNASRDVRGLVRLNACIKMHDYGEGGSVLEMPVWASAMADEWGEITIPFTVDV